MTSPYIVAIGGTLRPNSSTEWAMRHVLAAAQRAGARTNLISGPLLQLPLYQPDNLERGDGARFLVAELARADGIIVGSPGYHGSISGYVKNALDYAEDLRNEPAPYFDGRAVGCIAVASGWHGAMSTLDTLRSIVHALRGWPTPLGVPVVAPPPLFDSVGACLIPKVRDQVEIMARQVVAFATWRASGATAAA